MAEVIYEIYKTREIRNFKPQRWRYHGNYTGSVLQNSLDTLATALAEDLIRFKKVCTSGVTLKAYTSDVNLVSSDSNRVLGGNPGFVNQYTSLNENELAKLVSLFHREYQRLTNSR